MGKKPLKAQDMKNTEVFILDFTRGDWQDKGNYLMLGDEGISDGYFDGHVEAIENLECKGAV